MNTSTLRHLAVTGGGRIAYDLQGSGPLVILVPGMGELRSSYRLLAPALVEAGYTTVSVDLRGHGDSDADFDSYGDVATASDIAALIRELGGPAVIVGNSMAAGSAVIVAAEHPESVSGLVLIGPFVRNPKTSGAMAALFRVMTARPWVVPVWNAYLPSLYAGAKPDDFDDHRRQVITAMRRPGYARAFSATTRTDHTPAERRIGDVTAPTLVVMGERDPDFSDPRVEAAWVAEALGGDAMMVPDAGHYPHAQRADLTAPAVIDFVARVTSRA